MAYRANAPSEDAPHEPTSARAEERHPFAPGGKATNGGEHIGREAMVPGKVDAETIVSKCLWGLVPFLFMVALWTYLDRSNLAFAALPVQHDLHLNSEQYGLGAGVLFIGYVVGQIPSNLICERVGARIWLGVLIIAWGGVAAATAAAKNASAFYVCRFFLGLCEAGTFPGVWHHLSLFCTTLELGVAYAAVATATALSQVIGAPLATGMMAMEGICGLHGWQWLFIIEGCATAVYGAILMACLAPSPARAWFLTPAERRWLAARQDLAHRNAVATTASDRHAGQFWTGLVSWRLWYLGVCWFLVETTIYGVLFWTPLLLNAILHGNFNGSKLPTNPHETSQERSWQAAKLALISIAVFAPAACYMIVNAWSAKRHRERNLHAFIPVFISGICFIGLPYAASAGSPAGAFVLLIVAAIGAWAVHGAVGGFVGPYLIGALNQPRLGGYKAPMIFLGCCNLAAALLLLVFRAPDITNEKGLESQVELTGSASPEFREVPNAAKHGNGSAA